MLDIIYGTNNKPTASEKLLSVFRNYKEELDGTLFIGYPIIGTAQGRHSFDATYVSINHGLVLLDLIEGKESDEDYAFKQDDNYNKMESKLKLHKNLNEKRELMIDIHPITFAPFVKNEVLEESSEYPIFNDEKIINYIRSIDSNLNEVYYKTLMSALQSISNIRSNKRTRNIEKIQSRGYKLQDLEKSIANLDQSQAAAVIQMADGVQRIRGLAGSGKTIVLALKVAYIHAQHPEWKIAVTFHTRSLKNQFRKLINSFVLETTSEEPNWDNVHIIHSWGSHTTTGIYYKFCTENNLPTLFDFGQAKSLYGYDDAFNGACKTALAEYSSANIRNKNKYDVIVVDESQDFSSSFLNICYEMLGDNKRLIYAYDELQNLSRQSLPSPEEIFGKDEDGNPKVVIKNSENQINDIILEKCYRNSKPLLTTAHALGFGIYRTPSPSIDTGLVQIFENNALWLDVGYKVKYGTLEDGEQVVLERTSETSPDFLMNHSPIDDLIQFNSFETKLAQAEWVANEIIKNIKEDELRLDDIMVINPHPFTTKNNIGLIRRILFENGINSHLAGVDNSQDEFFSESKDSITFTGIFRAKGNEAGMVYVINADECYGGDYESNSSIAINRNRLFTAITRSKAWVRVSGVGGEMIKLVSEYNRLKEKQFTLSFTYPTNLQKEKIKIINRDVAEGDKKIIAETKQSLQKFISGLKSKTLFLDDLPPELIAVLKDEFKDL